MAFQPSKVCSEHASIEHLALRCGVPNNSFMPTSLRDAA